MNEGDENLAFMHQVDFVFPEAFMEERFFNFEDQLCAVIHILDIADQFRTCFDVLFIMVESAVAGSFFNQDGPTFFDHRGYSFG